MMRLPTASIAFATLSMICTIAYRVDAGRAFFWIAIFNVVVAGALLGLWVVEVYRDWRYEKEKQLRRRGEGRSEP